MGDNASKGFILRHVFGIELEHIGNVVELLRALLRLHYNKITIPELLSDRLVQMLKQRGVFHEWPLEEIVPDEKAFFAFLQERWPVSSTVFHLKKHMGNLQILISNIQARMFCPLTIRIFVFTLTICLSKGNSLRFRSLKSISKQIPGFEAE